MTTFSIDTCVGIQKYSQSDLNSTKKEIKDWLEAHPEEFDTIVENGFTPHHQKSLKTIYLVPNLPKESIEQVIVAGNGWPMLLKVSIGSNNQCLDTELPLKKATTSNFFTPAPLKIYHALLLEIARKRELKPGEILSSENLEFNPFGASRKVMPKIDELKEGYSLYQPTCDGERLEHKVFIVPSSISKMKPDSTKKVICVDLYDSKLTNIKAGGSGLESCYYEEPIFPLERLDDMDEEVIQNAREFIEQASLEFHI